MKITNIVPWRRNQVALPETEEPFTYLRQEMNRLFDDVFTQNDGLTPWREGRLGKFNPHIDVVEKDAAIEVTAELPGMEPDEIELNLTNDVLTLKGEKKVEHEEEGKGYYRMERHYGTFYRTIPLPHDVIEEEAVKSKFANGLLTITLPKREEAQTMVRHIPIENGK